MASLLDSIQEIRGFVASNPELMSRLADLEVGVNEVYRQVETWNSRTMDQLDRVTATNQEMFGDMHQLQVENALLKTTLSKYEKPPFEKNYINRVMGWGEGEGSMEQQDDLLSSVGDESSPTSLVFMECALERLDSVEGMIQGMVQ